LIKESREYKFNLKVKKNVNEYLSYCIEESKNGRKRTVIQPHLMACLIQNLGEEKRNKEVPYSRYVEV
jgi:hypothetical protein